MGLFLIFSIYEYTFCAGRSAVLSQNVIFIAKAREQNVSRDVTRNLVDDQPGRDCQKGKRVSRFVR